MDHGGVLEVAPVPAVLARWADPGAGLTEAERERAAAFATPALRDEFTAAHLLARECVARMVGRAPADVVITQRCAECGGPHGMPAVVGDPGTRVSWSHSHGWVAAVAAGVVVGVDIEAPRATGRAPDARLLRRTATPAESRLILPADDPRAAFLRMWVLKEALVKTGRLALKDFARTDVSHALGADAPAAEVLGCRVQLHAHPTVTVATAVLQEDS